MPCGILLLTALLALAPAAQAASRPAAVGKSQSRPFDSAAYISEYGEEAFRQRLAPILEAGPLLPNGAARYALGTGETAGALLDRSLRPARRLTVEEVELLIELGRLDPSAADPRALARFGELAALTRIYPALFGGDERAAEVASYLDGLASGAGDRVAPAGRGFPFRALRGAAPQEAPAVDGAAEPAPARPGLRPAAAARPAARGPGVAVPALAAPDAADGGGEQGLWGRFKEVAAAAVDSLGLTVDRVFEAGVKTVEILNAPAAGADEKEKPLVDPALPPAERLAALKKLAAEGEDKDLAKVFKELGAADLLALPETKAVFLAGLDRIEKNAAKAASFFSASALREIGLRMQAQGWLDGPSAARIAELTRKVIDADPQPGAFTASFAWEPLAEVKNLTDAEKKRVEAARAAIVERTLASLLASNKKSVDWSNSFNGRDLTQPPFAGDPRVAVFAEDLLRALPSVKGDSYIFSNRIGAVVEVLAKAKKLTPELALIAAEALAALPLDGNPGYAKNQLLSTDIPLRQAYEILSKDASAGHAERLKRYEAARERIADLHLPGVLASLGAADLVVKAKAVQDLDHAMFRGDARVRKALSSELETLTASGRGPGYEGGPRLFAALVKAVVKKDAPLDDKTFALVTAAAEKLGLFTPPPAGAPAQAYDAYLRGVETARNAIRASGLPPKKKKEALEAFDASFAAAYDAGRVPADPQKTLAVLLRQGKDWLGPTAFADSLAFTDPGSSSAYQAAIRETAALFFDRAALSNADARALSDGARRARVKLKADAVAEKPEKNDAAASLEALRGVVSEEEFARAAEFLSKVSGAEPPPSSAHIYLEAFRLDNMRSALAALPEKDPKRKDLAAALAAREKALADGLVRLNALAADERASGPGGSRDHVHARMTGMLALPPDRIPAALKRQLSRWLDENGALSATYTAFPDKPEKDGEDLRRGGAGRNVMMSLAGYRIAATDKEKSKRLAGLEETLHNFARHEPVLRATMHRYMASEHPHFYEVVGNSGSDGLAPYYYPSAIPRVLESFRVVLNDPAVRKDPARLKRVEASYQTVRTGLLREFDAGGLREPLRRDQPWYYTLLGTALAEVAALDAVPPGS